MLTGTSEPQVFEDPAGDWHIADGGRGLRYEHLTQNESAEKRQNSQVIGQFGMGLKEANDDAKLPVMTTSDDMPTSA